jgi:hypothetical protein
MTLSVLVTGRSAHAQHSDAEALFAQGNKLMQQGELTQACEMFEASNHAEPTAGTLIQLGKCLSRIDRIASAWSSYKDALSRVKDVTKRKIAGDAIATLEPRLSYLTISVPDQSRLEGLAIARDSTSIDSVSWNHPVAVDGDDYFITARAPGYQTWQTTVHVAAERDSVVVEIPRLDALPRPPEMAPVPAASSPAPPGRLPVSAGRGTGSTLSMTRKVAIGLGGTSVVTLATAAVLGTMAQGKHADASRLCSGGEPCARSMEANSLVRTGNRWAFDANIAWGIAGAAAIASGVLWLRSAPAEPTGAQISVVPSIASGQLGVAVIGRSSW